MLKSGSSIISTSHKSLKLVWISEGYCYMVLEVRLHFSKSPHFFKIPPGPSPSCQEVLRKISRTLSRCLCDSKKHIKCVLVVELNPRCTGRELTGECGFDVSIMQISISLGLLSRVFFQFLWGLNITWSPAVLKWWWDLDRPSFDLCAAKAGPVDGGDKSLAL